MSGTFNSKYSLAMPQWATPVLTPEGGLTPQWGYFFQGLLARAQNTASSDGALSLAQNAFELGMLGLTQYPEQVGQYEPLFDTFIIKTASYQIQAMDTGRPILFLSIGPAILAANVPQGVKVVIAAGNAEGLTIESDGISVVNGTVGAFVSVPYGQSAICEVIFNGGIAVWSVITIGSFVINYEGVTTSSIETLALAGDISLLYGGSPTISQSAIINDFHGPVTLSLPGPTTPGNYLVLEIGAGAVGFPSLSSGFTEIVANSYAGATAAIFGANVTSTSQGSVLMTGNSSAGGSGNFAVLREFANFTTIGATNVSVTTEGNFILGPAFGSEQIEQSLYLGFIVLQGVGYTTDSPPNFSSPFPPTAQIESIGYASANFEGTSIVGCELIQPNGNGNGQLGVWASNLAPGIGAAFVQIVGVPNGGNTATIVGTPTLVVDGFTISPTIQTDGMLEFIGPDTLAAFLTVAQNGTIQSTTISDVNVSGNGATLSLSGTTLNLEVPGQITQEGTLLSYGPQTIGANLTFASGTLSALAAPLIAEIGSFYGTVNSLVAGNNISFSGVFPTQTINSNPSVSANLTFENLGSVAGVSGTLSAGTGATISVTGGVATLSVINQGIFTLLASTTLGSAASEIDFLSIFTSSYDTYQIEMVGFQPTSGAGNLVFQFGNASGPTWETSANYYWGISGVVNNGGGFDGGANGDTSIAVFDGWSYSALRLNEATLIVKSPLNSAVNHAMRGSAEFATASAQVTAVLGGVVLTTTAYNSFRVLVTSGTIAAGTVRVYGIAP